MEKHYTTSVHVDPANPADRLVFIDGKFVGVIHKVRGMSDVQKAEALGRRLLLANGLSKWTFGMDDLRSIVWDSKAGQWIVQETDLMGQCDYTWKHIELDYRALRFSRYKIRCIILHEIAHALVGWKADHGPRWQAKARELGVPAHNIKYHANGSHTVAHRRGPPA